MGVECFVIVQRGAEGIFSADSHAGETQLARQPHALESLLSNLRDAFARGGLLDFASANIQMQPLNAGTLRSVNILIHTASMRGELDRQTLGSSARDQLLVEGL